MRREPPAPPTCPSRWPSRHDQPDDAAVAHGHHGGTSHSQGKLQADAERVGRRQPEGGTATAATPNSTASKAAPRPDPARLAADLLAGKEGVASAPSSGRRALRIARRGVGLFAWRSAWNPGNGLVCLRCRCRGSGRSRSRIRRCAVPESDFRGSSRSCHLPRSRSPRRSSLSTIAGHAHRRFAIHADLCSATRRP